MFFFIKLQLNSIYGSVEFFSPGLSYMNAIPNLNAVVCFICVSVRISRLWLIRWACRWILYLFMEKFFLHFFFWYISVLTCSNSYWHDSVAALPVITASGTKIFRSFRQKAAKNKKKCVPHWQDVLFKLKHKSTTVTTTTTKAELATAAGNSFPRKRYGNAVAACISDKQIHETIVCHLIWMSLQINDDDVIKIKIKIVT